MLYFHQPLNFQGVQPCRLGTKQKAKVIGGSKCLKCRKNLKTHSVLDKLPKKRSKLCNFTALNLEFSSVNFEWERARAQELTKRHNKFDHADTTKHLQKRV